MSVDNSIPMVALKVIETKPAVVSFNYREISNHLNLVLEKYKGLVFTESTVSECKKTIAELRKGQKALDEFRKSTKKQLTESVANFESQCKTLHSKFDEVIQPLTQQNDQFEQDRKEKKRIEIRVIIIELISEHCLSENYAAQLAIPEEYLNKGKSIKSIKAELTAAAKTFKAQQDKEEQVINLIKTKVELANARYQLSNGLIADHYLRLLAYKSVAEIETVIIYDAEKASVAPTPIVAATPVSPPCEMMTAIYEVTGTEEQLSALEAYLDASGLKWVDRPNG